MISRSPAGSQHGPLVGCAFFSATKSTPSTIAFGMMRLAQSITPRFQRPSPLRNSTTLDTGAFGTYATTWPMTGTVITLSVHGWSGAFLSGGGWLFDAPVAGRRAGLGVGEGAALGT
jgi:hypothetical protein